jgi:dihydrofolate synthase/folylpolyglutamate synthase
VNLQEWLTLLEARHPKTIDLGLDRCRKVWERMGSPRPAPQIFVVAGTNGKGSTVATICGLLSGLGFRHGSYTTPHLHRYNERIRLAGEAVSDEQLITAFEAVESARGEVSLSYFEFGTLAAIGIMSAQPLDFAVMEVGLGGRLDAVNLLDADCSVITPIGLDHQEYLGDDLESIGREKAGIIRAGRPLVCGEPEPPASVLQAAAVLEAPLLRLGIDFALEPSGNEACFSMPGVTLSLPMPPLQGPHQMNNAATALAAVLQLVPESASRSDYLARGIASVSLPGRLERVREDPVVWIDVGHNPLAARAVATALEQLKTAQDIRSIRCVLGMLADKDAAAVVAKLRTVISSWYCAGLEGERGQSAKQLAEQLEKSVSASSIREFQNVTEALEVALDDSNPADGVLVFGSFITASEASQALMGGDQWRGA